MLACFLDLYRDISYIKIETLFLARYCRIILSSVYYMIHFKVSADPVTEIGVQYYDICFHFKGDKSITIFHRDSPSIHDAIILHVPASIEVKQPQT